MNRELSLDPQPAVDLHQLVEHIGTRDDFVLFARALLDDLQRHPAEWENRTVGDYLEAIGAWTDDMDGYFRNRGEAVQAEPSWKLFGKILLAAKVYE